MSTLKFIKRAFNSKKMQKEKSLKNLLQKLEVRKEKIALFLNAEHTNEDIMDKKEELELVTFHINKGRKLLQAI